MIFSMVNLLGKRKPVDGLEKETTQGIGEQRVKLLETKSDEANLISVKETVEGLDDFAEEDVLRNKTLFVANLSPQTQVSDIINFFKDVAQVVHIRLILDHYGKHVGCGYVEFASGNEARKALEMKNHRYLHSRIILGETSYFVQELALPKKTLFFANLPRQTQISDIINFFKDVGEVVRVRFAVSRMRKHLCCCGFVEFASSNEAKNALQKKNGEKLHHRKVFLDVGELHTFHHPSIA